MTAGPADTVRTETSAHQEHRTGLRLRRIKCYVAGRGDSARLSHPVAQCGAAGARDAA